MNVIKACPSFVLGGFLTCVEWTPGYQADITLLTLHCFEVITDFCVITDHCLIENVIFRILDDFCVVLTLCV